MYRRSGSSESSGGTSPASERNGAPNLCNAVDELSSLISYIVCCAISSLFRSEMRSCQSCQRNLSPPIYEFVPVCLIDSQCSCFPVNIAPSCARGCCFCVPFGKIVRFPTTVSGAVTNASSYVDSTIPFLAICGMFALPLIGSSAMPVQTVMVVDLVPRGVCGSSDTLG